MSEDPIATLNRLIWSTDTAQESLRAADIAMSRVEAAIAEVKAMRSSKEGIPVAEAFNEALQATKEEAPIIYTKLVTKAAMDSLEYAYDAFLAPLIEVGDNPELYKITKIGAGWNSSIAVELDMNEVAGDLDDYAMAVEAVRDEFGVKEGRDRAKASEYWRTKVYGTARYDATISRRLSATTGIAPFWSLLENGSKNSRMASDIGGTPYPSRGGHHFVDSTCDAIKKYFLGVFRAIRAAPSELENRKKAVVDDAETKLRNMQKIVDLMQRDAYTIDKVAAELSRSTYELNSAQILKYAEMVRRGEELPEQITLGVDIRMRRRRFTQLVSGFGD